MTKPAKPYSKFSRVYDLIGADRHSARMVEYTFQIMHRFKIRPIQGLDLCCGTGTAIGLFLDRGLPMEGLDQSASMLAVASKKLAGRNVRLHQKALPSFRIIGRGGRGIQKYELITCFYDSLNYMRNSRELKTAFRTVRRHLAHGGWFVFDMNTPAALRVVWGGQVYAGTQDDLAWVWKNTYHEKTMSALCHTTFFIRRGQLWERFDEEHLERAYENDRIIEWLRGAGFEVTGFYRCFTFQRPTKGTYRVCAVVRRA